MQYSLYVSPIPIIAWIYKQYSEMLLCLMTSHIQQVTSYWQVPIIGTCIEATRYMEATQYHNGLLYPLKHFLQSLSFSD